MFLILLLITLSFITCLTYNLIHFADIKNHLKIFGMLSGSEIPVLQSLQKLKTGLIFVFLKHCKYFSLFYDIMLQKNSNINLILFTPVGLQFFFCSIFCKSRNLTMTVTCGILLINFVQNQKIYFCLFLAMTLFNWMTFALLSQSDSFYLISIC